MSKKTTHIKERKQEVRNPLFNDIMSDRQINAKRRTPQAKGNAPDEVSIETWCTHCIFHAHALKSFMPKGLSQKLLKEVRQQQNEEDDLYVFLSNFPFQFSLKHNLSRPVVLLHFLKY